MLSGRCSYSASFLHCSSGSSFSSTLLMISLKDLILINPGTLPHSISSFRFSEEHDVPDQISSSPLSLPGRTWRAEASLRNRWTGQTALWWCTPSVTARLSSTPKTSCIRSERAAERHVKGEWGSEQESWPLRRSCNEQTEGQVRLERRENRLNSL